MRVADLAGRQVGVWGAGVEGRAAVRFLARHVPSADVVVIIDGDVGSSGDHRKSADHGGSGSLTVETVNGPATVPMVSSRAGGSSEAILDRTELIIKSPGVSPYHGPFAAFAASHRHIEITGGTQLWFAEAHASGDLARTIAVTGSKGKSTTSSLCAHLLNGLGVAATLAGNVGRAPLDLLDEMLASPSEGTDRERGWVVLELSSFQSSEVRHSPAVGVLTTLFPEHLDWHGSVECYYADKCNLFDHDVGVLVANLANADVAERVGDRRNVVGYATETGLHLDSKRIVRANGAEVVDLATSPLRGTHNDHNLCGALTAVEVSGALGGPLPVPGAVAEVVARFRPLDHRLQMVGEWNGRLVVDDSLSTAPQAAIAALGAFADRQVGIIIGGHDRGLDYEALADAIAQRREPVFVAAVPQSGGRIVELIEQRLRASRGATVTFEVFDDFDAAVVACAQRTPVGGAILLSPAAPSFGRFRDYKERGLHFRSLLGF